MDWDLAQEGACVRLVAAVCDDAAPRPERERAWHELLRRIGPVIEGWAARSPILRQARLATPDDARAVLVAVLERLSADRFANLRLFGARRPPPAGEPDALDALARLGDGDGDDDGDDRDDAVHTRTPLRAWLRTLTRYLERDHVRRRLGNGDGRGKRGVTTDAEPLPTSGVAGERPPITDALTVAAVVAEVRAYMATFPDPMRRALERWLDDADLDDIAAELGLADAARARALIRAGQARLRERFRDRMPAMFGS